MSQSVMPHSDEVLSSLCRWMCSVPEHITRIYPFYPYFFTSEATDSVCNTTLWWSFEKFCADGHTLNQGMLHAPTLPTPTILLSEVYDSEWYTTLWWNLDTLCRWLYPIPEYITGIIPFSALILLIKVMNDSEDNTILWWILRNSIHVTVDDYHISAMYQNLSPLPQHNDVIHHVTVTFWNDVCPLNGYCSPATFTAHSHHHHYFWKPFNLHCIHPISLPNT